VTDLAEYVDKALEGLTRLDQAFDIPDARDGLTLLARIKESYNGWPPGKGFDAGSGLDMSRVENDDDIPPTHSDPTGEAGIRPDRARDDLRKLEKEARKAADAVTHMLDIASRYTLREANHVERQVEEEPGCESCHRVASPGTVAKPKSERTQWWNKVTRSTILANGRTAFLCRWCYDSPGVGARFTGELPPIEDVESYRDYGRARKRTA
jgi:hypothetical protein